MLQSVGVEPLLIEAALRLGAATLIGILLGIDRELRRKPAGMRTHALVSLGAATVTYVMIRISIDATGGELDPHAVSRAIQGIVAGVGFLGGGVILKNGSRDVKGLTTAASIWVVAALGIACGGGQWYAASVAVVFALIILVFGGSFERFLIRRFGRLEDEIDAAS